jgi:hypothetical protein
MPLLKRAMKVFLGRNPLRVPCGEITGRHVVRNGEDFYEIRHADRMRPFFMSVVSSGDHWLFISSTGALTAGRRDPDHALFPYYTDDKIHDSAEITGSKTLLLVTRRGRRFLWEPFSERGRGIYRVERTLRKSFHGDKLIFEEKNADLGVTFSYGWTTSERFGFVRQAWLASSARGAVKVRILDGLQNLLPSGLGSQMQLEKSTLVDAYKKNELLPDTGLGLFTLSSIPIDRPEPAEALRATAVWCLGLTGALHLLSSTQLEAFRRGAALRQETDVRAERGAYFVHAEAELRPGRTLSWRIVADVDQGPSQVAAINRALRRPARLARRVEADVRRGGAELARMVGRADGLQKTARPLGDARHFNNVLCNIMRGGVPAGGYKVDPDDLRDFIRHADPALAAKNRPALCQLQTLGRVPPGAALDPSLERLFREYLPLSFSRRHGDPSRPWNRFSIVAGALNYEGNWRDLFQNWEALALSFPGCAPGMICKFANASTLDGYNPYRVSRGGFEWETVEPHDPWSHIGYWGDHQVIYLLKLLENVQRHQPETLRDFLTRDLFASANVPYRIAPYEQLVAHPKETVHFDRKLDQMIRQRVRQRGADGKLVWDNQGRVLLVNLTEKLLISLLAKLSNFVPEAGLWLNTQRPEWNDANNALVGYGASVVTLQHLRRSLAFCAEMFRPLQGTEIRISAEVRRWLAETGQILQRRRHWLAGTLGGRRRKIILDSLGRAGARYRGRVYRRGLSAGAARLRVADLRDFLGTALAWIDHSIDSNRRPDGLYHSYNLISFERPGAVGLRRLYEMLEGQVAALDSARLPAGQSPALLRALRRSALFRPGQHTYLLYPDRPLPRFVDKNNIPRSELNRSRLLRQLAAEGRGGLIERDVAGRWHFDGGLRNARDVDAALGRLAEGGCAALVKRERRLILQIFERLFDHQSFTGRSGTFFGYEGLGCVYWHMVSKLRLAAGESFLRAAEEGAPQQCLRRLAQCYTDIRAGLGDHKSPRAYGAFPMDPYSHTPGGGGARQPGLTGQVKEDILSRFGELGARVRQGRLCFQPRLLRREEFLTEPAAWSYYDVAGRGRKLRLAAGSLAFTYCQVPVIYRLAREPSLILHRRTGASRQTEPVLDLPASRSIFERAGEVARVTVAILPAVLAG